MLENEIESERERREGADFLQRTQRVTDSFPGLLRNKVSRVRDSTRDEIRLICWRCLVRSRVPAHRTSSGAHR